MYILEGNAINKVYREGKSSSTHVLKDVNLSVKEGEFVSVMGPSGSGKSTLLYNISCMDRVTAGSVKFRGEEISSAAEDVLAVLRLRKMGFIFQQSNLLKNLTIIDNIIFPGYMAKQENQREINRRAEELMKKTGIYEIRHNDITQVSGGQLQRAAICRALINNPDIIFGDEPTGALNSRATEEILTILEEINNSGTAILLVTHDVKVAAKTERVVFMSDGMIVGEKYLGKFSSENNIKEREKKLSEWLFQMGF